MEEKKMNTGNVLFAMFMGMVITLLLIVILKDHPKSPHSYDHEDVSIGTHVEQDYEIDLRPNYIIVYSKNGNIDTIPFGSLEAFFERDNL